MSTFNIRRTHSVANPRPKSNIRKRPPLRRTPPANNYMQWKLALALLYADTPFIIRQGHDGYLVGKTTGFKDYMKTRAAEIHRSLIALKANGIIESFDWQGDFFTCKFHKPALFFSSISKLDFNNGGEKDNDKEQSNQ